MKHESPIHLVHQYVLKHMENPFVITITAYLEATDPPACCGKQAGKTELTEFNKLCALCALLFMRFQGFPLIKC